MVNILAASFHVCHSVQGGMSCLLFFIYLIEQEPDSCFPDYRDSSYRFWRFSLRCRASPMRSIIKPSPKARYSSAFSSRILVNDYVLWCLSAPPKKKSTEHTEDTEKDFCRMIKTIPQPSDFRPQNSDFIFALHLQYYSFWKAKSHIHNNDFCGLNSWQVELSPCFLSPQFSFSTNCVKYSYNFTWVCIIQWKL